MDVGIEPTTAISIMLFSTSGHLFSYADIISYISFHGNSTTHENIIPNSSPPLLSVFITAVNPTLLIILIIVREIKYSIMQMERDKRFELSPSAWKADMLSTRHQSRILDRVSRTSTDFHAWFLSCYIDTITLTLNPSALCRLFSGTEKHLGDFILLRCSNPRSYLSVYLTY